MEIDIKLKFRKRTLKPVSD